MKQFLLLLLASLLQVEGEPSGENTCTRQEVQTKLVNTTYLEAVRVKKHSLCLVLRIPPTCAEWVNTMETRWRPENVTRTVAITECCPGYRQEEGACLPFCSAGCGANGRCSAPETCSCVSGFSGAMCEVVGCQAGRWGEGCGQECLCEHGGYCHPVTGVCRCTPGYRGALCQESCPLGTHGAGCEGSCSCDPGSLCHHVTGDCLACQHDRFGTDCASLCTCHNPGTELCSPKDGRCFCRGNWFGPSCDLECPFGFVNKTCRTSPLFREDQDRSSCECPNDLYTCDPVLGCVCPPGLDCGLEMANQQVEVLSLPSSAVEKATNTAPIVVSVLIVCLVAVVLVILYYRRRMKVMKQDLQNRSVYYSDRESVDSSTIGAHDLIIRDQHPLPQENSLATSSNHLLNNVRLTLESQQIPSTATSSSSLPVKNVNVDYFKLGCRQQGETDADTLGELTGVSGAAAGADVNVFKEDYKSNEFSQANNKAVKADLEVMIRNNLAGETSDKEKNCNRNTSDKTDDDFLSKLKVRLP